MTLTADLRRMVKGPLGCKAEGPDGVVYGFYDREEAEVSGFTDLPRSVSRLDRIIVFRMPTEDVGAIARATEIEVPAQSTHPTAATYRVQDLRDEDDGLVTKLYLVRVTA